MPRQSAASIAGPHADPISSTPRPSANLSPDAVAVFHELISTIPRDHLRRSDAVVLEAYAIATASIRQADRHIAANGPVEDGRVSPWVRVRSDAAKTIASLSMRLRLCPQARDTSRAAGRNNGPPLSIYQRMALEEQEQQE